jgi:hypothetical protein
MQEEAHPDSSLSVSEAPQDLLFVTHPVNPLLSVHGRCGDGDAAFGDGVLAEGTEGFSWRADETG